MKKFLLFYFCFIFQFSYSQPQVLVSLIDENEGQIITLYTDTIHAQIYYNITGFESVGNIVLNVIFLFNDGKESRKEFDVISYIRNDDENSLDMIVKRDDGNVRYLYYFNDHILIIQSKGSNFLYTGDIIF
jgi:hypothetical protein